MYNIYIIQYEFLRLFLVYSIIKSYQLDTVPLILLFCQVVIGEGKLKNSEADASVCSIHNSMHRTKDYCMRPAPTTETSVWFQTHHLPLSLLVQNFTTVHILQL